MTLSWWDIPGPRRYVRRVENDLRDRVNVIAALPEGLGKDWFEFFRRRWAEEQERMDMLRITREDCSPLDALCEAFTTQPTGTTTLSALAREAGFRGRTVGLLLDRTRPVREWMDFLAAYERECRMIEPLDRTVFLLATNGVAPDQLPAPETQLRVHLYDGYARPQDCYMYLWGLLGVEEKHVWQTELKMALCSQLAQWDPRVCEVLVDRDIGSILRRGCSMTAVPGGETASAIANVDEGWARGILQRRDGEVVYHSGWLAMDKTSREFERRVWTAQLQVVFPLIEQVRHQVIETYGRRISLPVCLADGEVINDPYELEIAMVRALLYRAGGVPRNVMRRLDQALEFRNALAHLEPLSAEKLLQFEPDLRR